MIGEIAESVNVIGLESDVMCHAYHTEADMPLLLLCIPLGTDKETNCYHGTGPTVGYNYIAHFAVAYYIILTTSAP